MIDNPPTQRKSTIGERMDAGLGSTASADVPAMAVRNVSE